MLLCCRFTPSSSSESNKVSLEIQISSAFSTCSLHFGSFHGLLITLDIDNHHNLLLLFSENNINIRRHRISICRGTCCNMCSIVNIKLARSRYFSVGDLLQSR